MIMKTSHERADFGFNCWQEAAQGMSVAHQHDDIEFNLTDAPLTYLADGEIVSIPSGRIAFFWAARPHQCIDVEPGTELHLLTVPLGRFLSWGLPALLLTSLFGGRFVLSIYSETFEQSAHRFSEWARDFASGSEFLRETAALEIEAFVRRLSVDVEPGKEAELSAPSASRDLAQAGVMASFISEHSSQPITVADVAARLHVHPRYAMSLFKRVLGTTIGLYLAQSRVAQAQRMLLTTSLPVTEVGLASGFQSQSQFYEWFKRIRGMSPAAYRRLHRGQQ